MVRDDLRLILAHAVDAYGADLPLCETTVHPPRPAPTTTPRPEPPREPPPAPDPPKPTTLDELRAQVLPCTACKLAKGRNSVVFGEGAADARVMFIGEAPGRDEDRQGRPFVGRAGQLLDRIIVNAMGMRREDVYIANINKCRPPGNRDPEPDEVAACLPHLQAQISLIRPEVIVTLGKVAAWNLLKVTQSMGRLRGREFRYANAVVIPTWHPAYLLRTPSAKADTWEDIKKVNRLLGRPEVPD